MQCRYCGVKNPATVRVCVSCRKPLPVHSPLKWPEKSHTPHMFAVRSSIEPSASGSVSTHVGDKPRISRLMHSTSIPSAQASPTRPSQTSDGKRIRTETATGAMPPQAKPQAADSQQQRIEPQLDPPSRQPLRKPNDEELRAIAALYNTPQVPQRRLWMRVGIIAMIFVVGSAVGFGVASLLTGQKGASVLEQRRFGEQGGVSPGKGTSPGELPYDGNRIVESPSGERSAPALGVSNGELPSGGGNASGSSSTAQPDSGESLGKTSTPEALAASPEKRDLAPARSTVEKRPEQTAAPVAKKTSPASPRHRRLLRRSGKDREIERIKQQAAEELKKKTESQRQNSDSRNRARAASGRTLAMSARLVQCERAGNIFLRERCKWQLCDGKWGKNGCPSYLPQVSSK